MAAVVVLVAVALPPARLSPASGAGDDSVPGVFHVHSNRSDGLSSPEAIAAAAADVGLKFVIFTDHGDATRKPDPPTYRSGVLCIDAVEISTEAGHLVALGLPAAPYPLAGEARDVLEDVHRLGGVGIAAHPHSPRAELQWRDWDAAIDGVELLNLDTEWRARAAQPGWRSVLLLARSLSTYFIRPSETIAALVGGTRGLDAQWVSLVRRRRLPIFAGVDAHARLELTDSDPSESRWTLALPSYESVFKTLSMRVRPTGPLSGDATRDGAMILDALRAGHSYAALDGVMTPPAFSFSATSGASTAQQGDELRTDGPVELTVTSNAPSTFTTLVWRDSDLIYSQAATPIVTLQPTPGPAVYRAEIRAALHADGPAWILSNAIAVRAASALPQATTAAPPPTAPGAPARNLLARGTSPISATSTPSTTSLASTGWTTEASANAKIAVDEATTETGREFILRFGLPGGDVFDQYVAVVRSLDGGVEGQRRLTITARSDKPMRVSVQLRAPGGRDGDRWRRSIYLDGDERSYDLAFDDFRPVGAGLAQHPPLGAIHALLFVVEQTNTKPGTSGRVWLSNVQMR